MTKAAELRLKQLRDQLTNQIGSKLIDFQDRYLGAYVDYKFRSLEKEIKDLNKLIENEPKRMQADTQKGKRFVYDKTSTYQQAIKQAEIKLSRKNILICSTITEAKKGYDVKFLRLIDKLVAYNFDNTRVTVEKVGDIGTELSFLISNGVIECHARIILAQGEIIAPHYRFITTLRTLK